MDIYEEFVRLVKERGKRVEAPLTEIENVSSWKVDNLLFLFDESSLLADGKIITIIDVSDEKFFYILYISPSALRNGAKEFFGIIDEGISSPEKLQKILEEIKNVNLGGRNENRIGPRWSDHSFWFYQS